MEAGVQHHTPHFHAYYQEDIAVFSVDPVEMIAGSLPRRQQRLVRHGLNCIRKNYKRLGIDFNTGDFPQQLNP